jgi:3-hydroxyisobutyrate dehydrogenase-like beta-hydroxyacid dehydrogenase
MSAKLGFLGLGIMGYPMAKHLVDAGNQVFVWSNTAAKAAKLASEGAIACANPAQVAENADIIFLCVGDTAMSEAVIFGPDGLASSAKAGSIIVDCSTVAPSFAKKAHKELQAKQISFLDAPCTGSKPGAENGTLTFMVGGEKSVFDQVEPFFKQMGTNIYYCGGPGLGLHAKLTQNLVLSNLMQALNEGFVLASKAGVEPNLMLDILTNSAAKSGLGSFKMPFVFQRDFRTNFSTKWMRKDVGLMLDSGKELGVPLQLTQRTAELFDRAIAMGYGEDDFCSTILPLEEQAGTKVTPEEKFQK